MNWDEWRGSLDGRPTMFIMRLLRWTGLRVDLHKFVRADDEGCFHTHPAWAVRIVLWGGYEEEIHMGTAPLRYFRAWRPGSVGVIDPSYCHRISRLINGRSSYSLWLRWRVCADVSLRGPGWPRDAVGLEK